MMGKFRRLDIFFDLLSSCEWCDRGTQERSFRDTFPLCSLLACKHLAREGHLRRQNRLLGVKEDDSEQVEERILLPEAAHDALGLSCKSRTRLTSRSCF